MTYSATDIVLIIGAASLAATAIISAWRTSAKINSNQVETKAKLEEIHVLTNSNLSKMQSKLDALELTAKASEIRAIALQDIITALTKNTVVVPTVVTPGIPVIDKDK